MNKALVKKKEARFRFLKELYEETEGSSSEIVKDQTIGKRLGFIDSETDNILEYLRGEGLIDYISMDGGLQITHNGVVEVEEALQNPRDSTQHFPPVINVLNIQNANNSQLQQGTTGSNQNQTNVQFDDVKFSIESLIEELNKSKISETEKEMARTYGELLKTQAMLPEKSRDKDLISGTWDKLNKICIIASLGNMAVQAGKLLLLYFGVAS